MSSSAFKEGFSLFFENQYLLCVGLLDPQMYAKLLLTLLPSNHLYFHNSKTQMNLHAQSFPQQESVNPTML